MANFGIGSIPQLLEMDFEELREWMSESVTIHNYLHASPDNG